MLEAPKWPRGPAARLGGLGLGSGESRVGKAEDSHTGAILQEVKK